MEEVQLSMDFAVNAGALVKCRQHCAPKTNLCLMAYKMDELLLHNIANTDFCLMHWASLKPSTVVPSRATSNKSPTPPFRLCNGTIRESEGSWNLLLHKHGWCTDVPVLRKIITLHP